MRVTKITTKNVYTKFLCYSLTIEALKYVNEGIVNPKLMRNVMETVEVSIPPLEIQNSAYFR